MRDLVAVAREESDATAVDVRERADAVPLELPRPPVTCRRARAERCVHRPQTFGCEFPLRILRRIHAVDHPVLAARVEQHVTPAHAFAVEGHLHFLRLELVDLVRARVPHLHLARAVLPARDLPREGQVLERMVLGADREVVLPGVGGDALRHRPGREHAVALQTEIPVQGAGPVLLDDKPGAAIRKPGAADQETEGRGQEARLRRWRFRPANRPVPGSSRSRAWPGTRRANPAFRLVGGGAAAPRHAIHAARPTPRAGRPGRGRRVRCDWVTNRSRTWNQW